VAKISSGGTERHGSNSFRCIDGNAGENLRGNAKAAAAPCAPSAKPSSALTSACLLVILEGHTMEKLVAAAEGCNGEGGWEGPTRMRRRHGEQPTQRAGGGCNRGFEGSREGQERGRNEATDGAGEGGV
jgi:hypothetical protein